MNNKFLTQFTDFIFVEDPLSQADLIFLPGNSFCQMAEEAARLWTSGFAPMILPSGSHGLLDENFCGISDRTGRYPGIFPSEWDFLREILIRNGVPDQAILCEKAATYTYENAIYSRQLTDRLGLHVAKAIICCNAYHARRCLLYYQLLYPDTCLLIHPVDTGINRDNWYQTGEGIDTVLGEIERCGGQFHKILREL